jgi:Uncharacterized conserved protein
VQVDDATEPGQPGSSPGPRVPRDLPDFLTLPARSAKPRNVGLTHVIDRGVPLETARAVIDSCGDEIDFWKFGWGTSYVSTNLAAKLALLARAGIGACLGGTLMEIAWAQGKVDALLGWAAELGLPHVEVSRGTVSMGVDDKHALIARAATRFRVISEVGIKDPSQQLSAEQWRPEILGDLQAGATYVVAEGRESGTVGIYDGAGRVREEVVDVIVDACGPDQVIFEGPRKDQQAWFVRRFGPDVNIGNVALEDVVPLQTLRLGLRSDTIGLSVPAAPASLGERS